MTRLLPLGLVFAFLRWDPLTLTPPKRTDVRAAHRGLVLADDCVVFGWAHCRRVK